MKTSIIGLFTIILFVFNQAANSQTNEERLIRVGAAKCNFTKDNDPLPIGYTNIRDSLYARVIVIDNGITNAALIALDACMITDGFFASVSQKIQIETGIPAGNILVFPSHSHSAPFLAINDPNAKINPSSMDSKVVTFSIGAEKSIIKAVKLAKEKLQPAQIGYGEGTSFLNVNRDVIDPETRLWTQGPNYDGVSDHTVAVVKFETLTGEPIAVFYNFAMHANYMMGSGSVSAGIPGEISKYIEEYYNNKVIALWSMGAAGDQNPRYLEPQADVVRSSINTTLLNGIANGYDAISKALAGSPAEFQTDPRLLARQSQMIISMGQILGEEILRVIKLTKRCKTKIGIYSAQNIITCPGRTRTNRGWDGSPGTYVDGDPVNIKLSLLVLGDIAFAGVNAEVYNLIAIRLKEESPLANTILLTITNGSSNSGYIPSDDAFVRHTFQVLGSRLQPGCAENAIVNGFLDMIEQAK